VKNCSVHRLGYQPTYINPFVDLGIFWTWPWIGLFWGFNYINGTGILLPGWWLRINPLQGSLSTTWGISISGSDVSPEKTGMYGNLWEDAKQKLWDLKVVQKCGFLQYLQ
jgi:hypothetical protein